MEPREVLEPNTTNDSPCHYWRRRTNPQAIPSAIPRIPTSIAVLLYCSNRERTPERLIEMLEPERPLVRTRAPPYRDTWAH